jgi:hypothetical protein
MIGSIQEVLGWLYSWTTERWQRRENRRVHVDFSLAEPERDPSQLQGPDTVNPALSYRNMPIRSRYPYFAVHHDRPISASSLDRRRGREKLSRKERRSLYEEGVHDFEYCPLRPSEGFRQTGTFQVLPVVRRLSCQSCSCSWRGAIGGSSKKCACQSLV